MTESLIERIKERQWDHGKFPAVYVDDVDEIIRQHQSDHIGGADKMISSEISDVILAINRNYLSAIVKESETIPGHYYMPFRKGELYHINRLAEIVASTREPVSIELAAEAAHNNYWADEYMGASEVEKAAARQQARAIAKVWGLAHVD